MPEGHKEWQEYDALVDNMDEYELRPALKREARLRAMYQIRTEDIPVHPGPEEEYAEDSVELEEGFLD